ncbi:hypothetical protein ABW19_dt0205966 [Dactylella cylindrospora]|nr:hypothetical protein ABW19_dt0205966 [Dactylella cylindrospora]
MDADTRKLLETIVSVQESHKIVLEHLLQGLTHVKENSENIEKLLKSLQANNLVSPSERSGSNTATGAPQLLVDLQPEQLNAVQPHPRSKHWSASRHVVNEILNDVVKLIRNSTVSHEWLGDSTADLARYVQDQFLAASPLDFLQAATKGGEWKQTGNHILDLAATLICGPQHKYNTPAALAEIEAETNYQRNIDAESREAAYDLLEYGGSGGGGHNYRGSTSRPFLSGEIMQAKFLLLNRLFVNTNVDSDSNKISLSSYTKDNIPNGVRAALLLYYIFLIREEKEDISPLRGFIQRHLALRASNGDYTNLSDISPLVQGRDTIIYPRFSFSFHLPYIALDEQSVNAIDDWGPDREVLRILDFPLSNPFNEVIGNEKTAHGLGDPDVADLKSVIYKSVSSVFLTLVDPREKESLGPKEESLEALLCEPNTYWTAAVINAPRTMTESLRREGRSNLTPLTQFAKGTSAVVYTFRINMRGILEKLDAAVRSASEYENGPLYRQNPSRLQSGDGDYDLLQFYHSIIAVTYFVLTFLDANLNYARGFERSQLPTLLRHADASEKEGIEKWLRSLRLELDEIKLLQMRIIDFRNHVRELRDSLIASTSLIEGRMVAVQGKNVQVLSALSVIYIPASVVSGLFSIQVLPESATLASFIGTSLVLYTLTLAVFWHADRLSRFFRGAKRTASSYLKQGKVAFQEHTKKAKFKSSMFDWELLNIDLPEIDNSGGLVPERVKLKKLTIVGLAEAEVKHCLSTFWAFFTYIWMVLTCGFERQRRLKKRYPLTNLVKFTFSPTRVMPDLLRMLLTPVWFVILLIYFFYHLCSWAVLGIIWVIISPARLVIWLKGLGRRR